MNSTDLSRYDYRLPESLIARRPASVRDRSKLFVYDAATDSISFDEFRNIAQYLPAKTLLVLNETKVVPARITLFKQTGGKVIALLLVNEWQTGNMLKALVDREVHVGDILRADARYIFVVVRQEGKVFFLKPNVSREVLIRFLSSAGETPIPKYLAGGGMSERVLRERYQSVFAKRAASVAAPTASLHFTPKVFRELEKRRIGNTRITLHVGMGTFAPFGERELRRKKLFTEYYEISLAAARRINTQKKSGHPIIAVGTTATRALESAARTGVLQAGKKDTDIFIYPPYQFHIIDGLITNFHLPQSSLMLLADALLQYKKAKRSITDLYKIAIRKKFRFYSFGDAMLIR
ncbi:MAG: tRNA preQ1(34) S-adenosylmethionine ribosyltransferase-isomerase QueA [Candidatus Ryanbacteria bacterium]|nr:tRNA preQ1(34) S-adenosylmethionine ribosyltransferase-isomerase QueA [Candidatus Ryanbacteria bacterium]